MRKFENLAELNNIGLTLDTAEEREVYISEKQNQPNISYMSYKADRYKGIWNLNKNSLSCISSRKYALIQHQDAINQFIETLNNLNITGNGIVRDFGDKVIVEFLFSDKLIDDGEKGIRLGIRLINSYDMSHSLSGELYAYRLVCSNGMVLGRAIHGVKFSRWHSGIIDIKEQMRRFIQLAIESDTSLQSLINEAMANSIEWELTKTIIQRIFRIEKYRKLILEQLEPLITAGKTINRWELYNAVTYVASNGKELKQSVIDNLQRKAQSILAYPINNPLR